MERLIIDVEKWQELQPTIVTTYLNSIYVHLYMLQTFFNFIFRNIVHITLILEQLSGPHYRVGPNSKSKFSATAQITVEKNPKN